MIVYLIVDDVAYEGDYLYGAYSTEAEARAAWEAKADKHYFEQPFLLGIELDRPLRLLASWETHNLAFREALEK